MATPNRLAAIETQRGQPMERLIPQLLNQLGSMEAVAQELGVHYRTVYRWCEANRVQKRMTYFLPPSNGLPRRIIMEMPNGTEVIYTYPEAG